MHNIPDVPLTTAWQLLERLHDKLKTMKGALQGHVYDVISDLLTLNGIDFERLIKDTLLNPGRIEAAKQPEYVEAYFLDAAERVRLWVERRADTLLRIEHVPRSTAVNRDLRRPRDDAAVIHSPVQL